MKTKIFTQAAVQRASGQPNVAARWQHTNKMITHCMLVVFLITAGMISTPVHGATVTASGAILTINLNTANNAVSILSTGTTYTFTLTAGSWTGSPWPEGVSVSGSVLTVNATGLSTYSDFSIINSAASPSGNSVTFTNSGTNAYSHNFSVLLINSPSTTWFNGTSSFTGSAGISIVTEKNINFQSLSLLSAVDGNITLEANQQSTPTAGSFIGIEVSNAMVQVTGIGTMTLKGKGGNTAIGQHGVIVQNGGKIIGGTTGALTVEGYGGSSSSNTNLGVQVNGGTSPNFSTITSAGCNVTVIGVGGGQEVSSSMKNFGILVGNDFRATGAGIISSGGAGTVTLNGTGGTGANGYFQFGVCICGVNAKVAPDGTGSVSITGTGGMSEYYDAENIGVFVDNSATIISGDNGSVTVTGTGGCDGKPVRSNYGVYVNGGGKITSKGASGTVTVNGTGGASTYPMNIGVYLTGGTSPNFSTITSGGGNVSVTGTGGGSGASGGNYGVYLDEAAIITSGSDGSVTVTGNGGGSAGTGSNNYGVYVYGKGKITSGGAGNVAVTGTGGNSSGNGNYGVYIQGGTDPDFSMITSGGGNVTVTGTGKGTGDSRANHGVILGWDPSHNGIITSGGTGSVTVIGTASNDNTGNDNYGVFISGTDAKILSGGSGSVNVTGTGGGTGSSGFGLGVSVHDFATITSGTDGSVNVTGYGGNNAGTGNGNYGLQVVRGGIVTSSGAAGTVTVTGTGSNSSGFRNVGVCVNAGTSPNFATISSGGGDVTITGTGGGRATSYSNYGVWLGSNDASGRCMVSAGGTGSLTITGQGGAATGSSNFGVYIDGDTAKILTAGSVTITGKEGGSTNGYAITMVASGSVTSTGTGSLVKLIGNSMEMTSSTSVSAPDGYVNILPRTAGVNTDLGSATVNKSGPLAFTNNQFGRISADTITFGSATSDTITISQNLTASTGSSIKLSTLATGGVIPSATVDFSMTGQTLSFGTGTPLRIAINGTTVNSGFKQLSVNGSVNLAGSNLLLSGTYTPVDGDVFTIVSATSVSGIFDGLPNNTEIIFNTQKLKIKYTSTTVILKCELCSNPTDGGTIAENQTICSGSLPAEITSLTLPTGHTGDLEFQWQSSTTSANAGFGNIQDAVDTTFQPSTLTATTWFRRLACVGCMSDWDGCDTSNVVKITATPANFSISGTARYVNNPQTPLNGLKIVLNKLVSNSWVKIDSVQTTALGFYNFTGLANATYGLTIKSAHPGGQWQTWGGVNNTDALLVLNHINNTSPLPVNPPVIRVAASVKMPHPAIQNNDYLAIRQAAKSGWGYFDTTKWVFSGVNTATRLDTFSLACDNVTRDIRGLCAGDVNGTYVPANGYKIAGPEMQLVNQGTLPLTREIVFPVRTDHDLSLGAITLMLDYDPSKVEITGVEMPQNGGVEPWFETRDGVLYIGWMSTNPVQIGNEKPLLLIHARLTEAYRNSDFRFQISDSEAENSNGKSEMRNLKSEISFALNDNPLSELADGDGNVISGVKLTIPTGADGKTVKWQNGNEDVVSVYPNPAKEVVYLQVVSENESRLSVEIYNMLSKSVLKSESLPVFAGLNTKSFDVSMLPCGAYMIKVTMNDRTECRKVIVNR